LNNYSQNTIKLSDINDNSQNTVKLLDMNSNSQNTLKHSDMKINSENTVKFSDMIDDDDKSNYIDIDDENLDSNSLLNTQESSSFIIENEKTSNDIVSTDFNNSRDVELLSSASSSSFSENTIISVESSSMSHNSESDVSMDSKIENLTSLSSLSSISIGYNKDKKRESSSINIFDGDINNYLISFLNFKKLIKNQIFDPMSHIPKNKINKSYDASLKLLDVLSKINYNKFLSILFPNQTSTYSWEHLKDFAFNNNLLQKYITTHLSQDLSENDDDCPKFLNDVIEDSIWTEKYSPKSSSEVLSNKKYAEKIIDWLNKWKIGKIELPTVTEHEISEGTSKRGRKKKNADPVYHPEDDIFMGYYDYNSYNSLSTSQSVETKDDKFLYLIGPPASGKSSTIAACAYECGFEILEIYPGVKRSGKDITNIIGDLTQSHIVSQMSSEKSLHSPKNKISDSIPSPSHSIENININNSNTNVNVINVESSNEKNKENSTTSSNKKETSVKGN